MEAGNQYFAGIDLGSTMTKAVIVDGNAAVCSTAVRHTGAAHRQLAHTVMAAALDAAGLAFERIAYVVATGYGRMTVPFADHQVTEINCHAAGVAHQFPDVRLAIDIGGQDAKALKIRQGRLVDFVMSDKCAAGTGRFLEVIAKTLDLELEQLGALSLESTQKVSISSVCTVFARQEVVAGLSRGIAIEDILAGIHDAIASRTVRMAERFDVAPDIVFTGGVAKNKGVVASMEARLGHQLHVPENPLISGALGAALIGKTLAAKAAADGTLPDGRERRLGAARFFN